MHIAQTYKLYGSSVQGKRKMLSRITRLVFPAVFNICSLNTVLYILGSCNTVSRNCQWVFCTFLSARYLIVIDKLPVQESSIADYPETKSVQMYKNNIFDPLNLSSIGENSPLIEEKKIDFSLDSFKSNVSLTLTYTFCIIDKRKEKIK